MGQSLSEVSLKGDLAIRLLRSDPAAARLEIESLTGVACDALRGIRAVSHDQQDLAFRDELEGAAALLSAAGVQTRLDLHLPELAPSLQRLLGWAVREGATNVLRHSAAQTCSITARAEHGMIVLEVQNDRAFRQDGDETDLTGLTERARAVEVRNDRAFRSHRDGSRLAGVAERARALDGSMSTGWTPDGGFRLLVEVPEDVPPGSRCPATIRLCGTQ